MTTLTEDESRCLHRYITVVEEMLDDYGDNRAYDVLEGQGVISNTIMSIMEKLKAGTKC